MNPARLSRRRILAGVAAAAALPFAGCASYERQSRTVRLEESVQLYAKAVRWSDFEQASAFLLPRDGKLPTTDPALLKAVRVVSDDFRIGAASPEATEATMVATFKYQFVDSAVVRTVVQNATWWFDAGTNSWFIDGGLPDFER